MFQSYLRRVFWLAVVAVAILQPISTTRAATITAPAQHLKATNQPGSKVSPFWPTDPVQCDLILEGEIRDGDAAQLARLFADIVGTTNSFTFFLCLRSEGGDMQEAVNLANLVRATQRPSIATVVEDSQTCASACAIVFLAGNGPAARGAFPQRFLHPRGRLMYHSSYLPLSGISNEELKQLLTKAPESKDEKDFKGRVAEFYDNGLRDMQAVLSAFKGHSSQRDELGQPWVRPSLFLETFAQNQNEWICVDSVNTAGRWDIQVFGYKPPASPSKQQSYDLCNNAFHWLADEFAEYRDDAPTTPADIEIKSPPPQSVVGGRKKAVHGFQSRQVLTYQAPMSNLSCVAETRVETGKRLEESAITTFFVNQDNERNSAIIELSPFAYLPHHTLLADLPGVRPVPTSHASAGPAPLFKRFQRSLLHGCSFKRLAAANIESCEKACATDARCKAYSYSAVEQRCELKHTITARRSDPIWVTGAPVGGWMPTPSTRPVKMAGVKWNRIEGDLIEASTSLSEVACKMRCESDHECAAYSYDQASSYGDGRKPQGCRRYSTVQKLWTFQEQDANQIYIKRQE